MNNQMIRYLSKTRWSLCLVLAWACFGNPNIEVFGGEGRKVPDSTWTKNGELSFPDGIDQAARRDAYSERGKAAEAEQYKPPPANTRTPTALPPLEWTTIFMYLIIGLVAVVLLGSLIYLFRENWFFLGRREKKQRNKISIPEAKLMDLPFQMETPLQGLLEEAKAAFTRGDFNAAIVFLYAHILVELDGARLIHLQRGKTNGMYARELRPHIQLRKIVVRVVGVFELAFFGKYKIQREQFIECWNSLDEFKRILSTREQDEKNAAAAKSVAQASIASGVGS